jgi:hypothetical protein
MTHGPGNSVEIVLRAGKAKPPAPQSSDSPLGEWPATFTGLRPCADCEGIRWHLDLLPDQPLKVRLTYLGKPPEERVDAIGWWRSKVTMPFWRRLTPKRGKGLANRCW